MLLTAGVLFLCCVAGVVLTAGVVLLDGLLLRTAGVELLLCGVVVLTDGVVVLLAGVVDVLAGVVLLTDGVLPLPRLVILVGSLPVVVLPRFMVVAPLLRLFVAGVMLVLPFVALVPRVAVLLRVLATSRFCSSWCLLLTFAFLLVKDLLGYCLSYAFCLRLA